MPRIVQIRCSLTAKQTQKFHWISDSTAKSATAHFYAAMKDLLGKHKTTKGLNTQQPHSSSDATAFSPEMGGFVGIVLVSETSKC